MVRNRHALLAAGVIWNVYRMGFQRLRVFREARVVSDVINSPPSRVIFLQPSLFLFPSFLV